MTYHSLYGRKLGFDSTKNALVTPRIVSTGPGELRGYDIEFPSYNRVADFDDFLKTDTLPSGWTFTEGTDSTTSGIAISGVNGELVITPGDSAGTVAADYAQVNTALVWQGKQNLWLLAKVKLASIASVSCFVGFTDTLALEGPIHSAASADTLTSNATDAVGFMFDTNMSTDNWWAVGVANDTDATAQNLAVAPVAATYETLGVRLTYTGSTTMTARFYRNGVQIGSDMSAPLTYNVALTPHIGVRPLSAAAGKTITVDYVNVAGDRI